VTRWRVGACAGWMRGLRDGLSPGPTTGGTVTFMDGSTASGTGVLNTSGIAAYSSSSFGVGSHSLTADDSGGKSYLGLAPSAKTLTVTAPLAASSVALTVSSANAMQGLPIELVATVTASSGNANTTGSVNFTDVRRVSTRWR
jgi:hypothetical protein